MRTQPNEIKYKLLQSAAAATGNGNELTVGAPAEGGYTHVGIQVTGTFTATVTFEATIDGSNWFSIAAVVAADGSTVVTTAAAAGAWRIDTRGLYKIRARVSAYTSGSVTVAARAFSS